jgi:hypothetical protein
VVGTIMARVSGTLEPKTLQLHGHFIPMTNDCGLRLASTCYKRSPIDRLRTFIERV